MQPTEIGHEFDSDNRRGQSAMETPLGKPQGAPANRQARGQKSKPGPPCGMAGASLHKGFLCTTLVPGWNWEIMQLPRGAFGPRELDRGPRGLLGIRPKVRGGPRRGSVDA